MGISKRNNNKYTIEQRIKKANELLEDDFNGHLRHSVECWLDVEYKEVLEEYDLRITAVEYSQNHPTESVMVAVEVQVCDTWFCGSSDNS